MNFIWTAIIFCSLICIMFTSPDKLLSTMLDGTNKALNLSFELLAIYSLWLGILGIVSETKLSKLISKSMNPLINLLWGKNSMNENARKYLSMSLSTQLLGIGGASVPFGIKAIEEMYNGREKITKPMIMTIVFACSGVQLLPTTVMGLMTASGSTNPTYIILPTIISSLSTTIVGVLLAIVFSKLKFNKTKKIYDSFKNKISHLNCKKLQFFTKNTKNNPQNHVKG